MDDCVKFVQSADDDIVTCSLEFVEFAEREAKCYEALATLRAFFTDYATYAYNNEELLYRLQQMEISVGSISFQVCTEFDFGL